ncbi:MAG: hypothetical protein IKN55_01990 [Oscillospiraceae bacterium]|nr:hypothetical protein [Oscillospiraceae bacterium]
MKRRISAIIACLLACAMLAGCGKKPEQGSAAPADASAPNGNAQDPQEGQSSAGNPDDSSEASVGDSGIPYEPIAEDGDLKMPATPVVPPANSGKIHVTVESVSVTMEELKAQNYTVPVLVTIDKNPGIIYSEWGLHIDPKCTFTSTSEGCRFQTVHVENAEQHFLWTAWTTATPYDKIGTLLEVELTLPMDAKPGDSYTITYADTSLADKGNVWSDGSTDYGTQDNGVTWTDGGVTITG